MQSVTKNRQSPGTLRALAAAAFPTKQVASVDELTEGMFNAAYRVDFTRTLCSGTCFFMEVMPGKSLQSCRDDLPDETVSAVMGEVGAFQRRLAEFHSDRFGLLGDERRFDTLYELERYMFGNVLRDAAAGVIDWERALWGDPFMDDCFRTRTRHPAFAEGFGLHALTAAQQRRILWYDVFLYVTMLVECRYRQCENAEPMAAWFRRLMDEAWLELNGEGA